MKTGLESSDAFYMMLEMRLPLITLHVNFYSIKIRFTKMEVAFFPSLRIL